MLILTPLLVLLSLPVLAKNHVAFIGGGGEPDGPKTIFDSDIPLFGKFVNRSPGTELTVSFNGGHSKTEEKIRSSFPKNPNVPFTAEAFEKLVTQYENDLGSGKIGPGDKLMLFIDSHGAERQSDQSTHFIATSGGAISNYDSFSGPRTVSLDRLQNLAALAEQKGVPLAIIDVSCHSGASLPLANSKTCVISATGPRHYGFASRSSFGAQFMNGMRPGRNLEELFHDVRDNSAQTDFPMISAGAGKDVQDEIYPLLTRFLFDYEKKSPSKLKHDLINSVTTNSCQQEDESLNSLITLLSDVEAATQQNYRKLRDAVTEYQNLRTSIQAQLTGVLSNPLLTEKRQVCEGGMCFTYTGEEVLAMNIDQMINVAREAGAKSSSQSDFYRNWQSVLEKIKPWKAQLIANPALAAYPTFFENYPGLERTSEALAKKISVEERRLYREMTKSRSSEHNGSNPCRDFVI